MFIKYNKFVPGITLLLMLFVVLALKLIVILLLQHCYKNNKDELMIESYKESKADKYEGKTIRVRGFAIKKADFLPKGYFAIGKYAISCCAADAGFTGFMSKYDNNKIKVNQWYEVEGVLRKGKDKDNNDTMYIEVINIKEIDSKKEEQYVYPCYSYGDNSCSGMTKYDLEY